MLNEDSVSLYGEVQKEVIESTLETDFGLEVDFQEPTPIHIERPLRSGESIEVLHSETNPFRATVGLRIDPAPPDSGFEFRLDIDPLTAPMYLYKTLNSFSEHMARYVRETLQEGLHGWQVTDCVVTMTSCAYSVPDGPPSKRGPLSTSSDYRKLTPIVLMQALEHARTSVCEPVVRVRLEVPAESVGAVLAAVGQLGAPAEMESLRGDLATVDTVLSILAAQDLQRAAVEPDERRGRARNDLPRLRAGQRRPSDPPAKDGERAQPRGVHAPCREPCVSIAAAQR